MNVRDSPRRCALLLARDALRHDKSHLAGVPVSLSFQQDSSLARHHDRTRRFVIVAMAIAWVGGSYSETCVPIRRPTRAAEVERVSRQHARSVLDPPPFGALPLVWLACDGSARHARVREEQRSGCVDVVVVATSSCGEGPGKHREQGASTWRGR